MSAVDMRPHSATQSISAYPCLEGYDHIHCAIRCWLGFLYCPHKLESVGEVSEQGLMSEEESVTRHLLALEWVLLWTVLCNQL